MNGIIYQVGAVSPSPFFPSPPFNSSPGTARTHARTHAQGNAANRTVIREYEWYYQGQGQKRAPGQFKFNVLLTTYEMILRTDWAELSKINWKALIIDEAHRLKNKRSKLLERLKLFKTDHRIILTGTPLQNNTEELWTLLNFIEPHIFTSLPSFLQNFGDLKDAEQVGHLHTVLRPHLLRRLKEDVESSIPPKEEVLVEVELTSLQKKYYRYQHQPPPLFPPLLSCPAQF
jgi:SNF2 family DNA or RNA helicase